ncbi:PIN domain-containing protein [Georgenia sp. Marseille-Q6866]
MARRLILDTNVLIDYERGRLDQAALDDDELAIAAITVAEYRTGIELADSVVRAAARSRALALITETIEVLDYTEVTAAHHARLMAHTRRSGSVRGVHDLVIAAHAAQTGRVVLSRGAVARFGDLPGVIAEEPAGR